MRSDPACDRAPRRAAPFYDPHTRTFTLLSREAVLTVAAAPLCMLGLAIILAACP